MENEILSLKTIYKFLFVNDYPAYAQGIFTEENKKGITLTKFWQSMICYEFKSGRIGKKIWKEAEGRNRYISDICNRSKRLNYYQGYAIELKEAVTGEHLLEQIQSFAEMLDKRQFDYDAFSKKLNMYLEVITKSDELLTKQQKSYLENGKRNLELCERQGEKGREFGAGWFLTILMLYALCGPYASSVADELQDNSELEPKELWKSYYHQSQHKAMKIEYLTYQNTELNVAPLAQTHYFGREKELFDLKEAIAYGGKYLVSGIGGAGKTELLRQLLKIVQDEKLADFIGTIQYKDSIAESMSNAFFHLDGEDAESKMREIIARIQEKRDKRILLFIDNMNYSRKEDPLLQLLEQIPATIVISSRKTKLNGFQTYQLNPISQNAGALIFRDNYSMRLKEEDCKYLDEILQNPGWCHTLTLRMLAKAAGARKWTVKELVEQLKQRGIRFTYKENGSQVSLTRLYHQMYSFAQYTEVQKKMLQLFSVLPYQSISEGLCEDLFYGIVENTQQMHQELLSLVEEGFLEVNDRGYSMHPFIAEGIRPKSLNEEQLGYLYQNVLRIWKRQGFYSDGEWDYVLIQRFADKSNAFVLDVSGMLIEASRYLKVPVSEEIIQCLIVAFEFLGVNVFFQKNSYAQLKRIVGDYKELDSATELQFLSLTSPITECDLDLEEAIAELRELKQKNVSKVLYARTVSLFAYRIMVMNPELLGDAEQMLLEVTQDESIPAIFLGKAYWFYSHLCERKGEYQLYLNGLEQSVQILQSMGAEPAELLDQYLDQTLLYAAFGMRKEAQEMLQMIEQIDVSEISYIRKASMEHSLGVTNIHIGEIERAITHMAKSVETIAVLGVEHGEIYETIHSDYGMALSKGGRYQEAWENYRLALTSMEQRLSEGFILQVLLNNIGVMFLEWDRPESSLEYLSRAYELGQAIGEIPAAESANNLSKAYHKLGERKQEQRFLLEAYPILEKTYGVEHPKVKEARERKELLTQ